MLRKIYETGPIEDIWSVTLSGAFDVTSYHETKEEAILAGRALARRAQPSLLLVRNHEGSIERQFIYGKDPIETH